jgi:hypothetical protein
MPHKNNLQKMVLFGTFKSQYGTKWHHFSTLISSHFYKEI